MKYLLSFSVLCKHAPSIRVFRSLLYPCGMRCICARLPEECVVSHHKYCLALHSQVHMLDCLRAERKVPKNYMESFLEASDPSNQTHYSSE